MIRNVANATHRLKLRFTTPWQFENGFISQQQIENLSKSNTKIQSSVVVYAQRVCMPVAQMPLQWRHNDYCSVSNHQPHGCLLNRLFRRRSKKTSKLRVTGLCAGNSPGPVNSPPKGPVTRKMFPFDDVIMPNRCVREALAIWDACSPICLRLIV